MKIEIYNKKTDKVEGTKEIENLKGFMKYWCCQCDSKNYGYRLVGDLDERPKND